MSNTETVTVVSPPETDIPEIAHQWCCHNENLMLCGLISFGPMAKPDEPDCIECELTADRGECPKFGLCVREPDNFN